MSFTVSATELRNKVAQLAKIVPTKSVLPITTNIHFRLEGNQLELSATDLENSLRTWLSVEATGEQTFDIAFPAKLLMDTLKALPEQPLTFELEEGSAKVAIKSENGAYHVNCENGDDFPDFPSLDNYSRITMNLDVLTHAVRKVLLAASTDELKPAMNGMLFEFGPSGATFVCTDAHRLVRYRRSDVQTDQELSFIMPQKALKLLGGVAEQTDVETVQIDFDGSNALYRVGGTLIVSRLINDRFPDYQSVIPANSPAKAILNKDELIGTMKRLDLYSNKTTRLGRFSLSGNVMKVHAEDLDFDNQADESLHCLYEGEDLEIGFNVSLMMDIIANVDTDDVTLELESPGRATVVLPSEQPDGEDILMLLMPVMLSSN